MSFNEFTKEELASLEERGIPISRIYNQSASLQKYDRIVSAYGLNDDDLIHCPDNYGGCYLDDDGKLTVLFTEDVRKWKTEIESIVHDDDIKFIEAKNAYVNLKREIDNIYSFFIRNPEDVLFDKFVGGGVYQKENVAYISLTDISDAVVTDFKRRVTDSDIIVFEKANSRLIPETDIHCGDKFDLYKADGSYRASYSLAYRVKNSNQTEGFISSAHGGVTVGDTVKFGNIAFGACTVRQLGGKVDASLMLLGAPLSYQLTNFIDSQVATLSISNNYPSVGAVVYKCGDATGITSGTISDINAIASVDGQTVQDLTAADYNSAGGDSGGLIYTLVTSPSVARYTTGVHMGSFNTQKYFCKAGNVAAALGVSRY
jgi:hypothetical protein